MSDNLQDRIEAWESNQFELIEGGALLDDIIPAYRALLIACEASTKRADDAEREVSRLRGMINNHDERSGRLD